VTYNSNDEAIETPVSKLDDFELGRAAYAWFE
jgi:hypothetical protein